MALNICLKFHENISNGFNVTERTRVCGRNGKFQCSKGNNYKSLQPRVTVLVLIVLNMCVRFHENIINGLKLQSGHEYVLKLPFSMFKRQ